MAPEPQPSSWIDQRVASALDELGTDVEFDLTIAFKYIRYIYAHGYIEGTHDRAGT